MTEPTAIPAPGETFQRRYTVFAELTEVYRTYQPDDSDIPAAAQRAVVSLGEFCDDAELLETCREKYVRTGGQR